MTKAMSNEWAKHGINVNCICPGLVAFVSDSTRHAENTNRYIKTALTKVYTDDAEYTKYIVGRTPAGLYSLRQSEVQRADKARPMGIARRFSRCCHISCFKSIGFHVWYVQYRALLISNCDLI